MPVSLVLFVIATLCFLALAIPVGVGIAGLQFWGLAFVAAGLVSEKTKLG